MKLCFAVAMSVLAIVLVIIKGCHSWLFLANSQTMAVLLSAILLTFSRVIQVGAYPNCLLKQGECLDGNQGPLLEAVKPKINHNIANETIFNVTSVKECAVKCYENEECNYFTFYKEKLGEKKRDSCNLVGFNLRQACFNLEKACVFLKACDNFDKGCKTCQVK